MRWLKIDKFEYPQKEDNFFEKLLFVGWGGEGRGNL